MKPNNFTNGCFGYMDGRFCFANGKAEINEGCFFAPGMSARPCHLDGAAVSFYKKQDFRLWQMKEPRNKTNQLDFLASFNRYSVPITIGREARLVSN